MNSPNTRGRPPLAEAERAQNTLFRLRPEVDAALNFVMGAGNYKNRTEALSALVLREAKRLGRDSVSALAGRVAQRAHDMFQELRPLGRLNRAELLLRAYILELAPEARDVSTYSPHEVAMVFDRVALAASTGALDWIASHTPGALVETLDVLGVATALTSGRRAQVFLEDAAGELVVQPRIPTL
jgi:hypothetical protein